MASFKLNYLFQGSVSKYSHILMYLGLVLQDMNLWGNNLNYKRTHLLLGCLTLRTHSLFEDLRMKLNIS